MSLLHGVWHKTHSYSSWPLILRGFILFVNDIWLFCYKSFFVDFLELLWYFLPRTYLNLRSTFQWLGAQKFQFLSGFFFSIGPRWLMPRMHCSQIGLLYYPKTFQLSPLVSFYEVLAARGGDVYEPSYFRMFQLSPLVVFKRSSQRKWNYLGEKWPMNFAWKCPTST